MSRSSLHDPGSKIQRTTNRAWWLTCALLKAFEPEEKSDTMARVTPWIRRAIWLLVIYGILHLLISPLPELGAALSGKSVLGSFAFVTYALLGLFFLTLLAFYRTSRSGFSSAVNVLEKLCFRLC